MFHPLPDGLVLPPPAQKLLVQSDWLGPTPPSNHNGCGWHMAELQPDLCGSVEFTDGQHVAFEVLLRWNPRPGTESEEGLVLLGPPASGWCPVAHLCSILCQHVSQSNF